VVEYLRVFRHVGFFVFRGAGRSESTEGFDVRAQGGDTMSLLARSLLWAAGLEYDAIDETWVARMPLCPLVAVECDEGRAYIQQAMVEVQAILDAIGCVYCNFVINDRIVTVAGPIHGTMCGNVGDPLLTDYLTVSHTDEIIHSSPPPTKVCFSA
jgi:hypothetical protein